MKFLKPNKEKEKGKSVFFFLRKNRFCYGWFSYGKTMTFGLLKKDLREKRKGEKKFGGVFKFIVDINYMVNL